MSAPAGNWSARCDCRKHEGTSASGRCNSRNVTDPDANPGEACYCPRCKAECRKPAQASK